jgi:hypothetical protein
MARKTQFFALTALVVDETAKGEAPSSKSNAKTELTHVAWIPAKSSITSSMDSGNSSKTPVSTLCDSGGPLFRVIDRVKATLKKFPAASAIRLGCSAALRKEGV